MKKRFGNIGKRMALLCAMILLISAGYTNPSQNTGYAWGSSGGTVKNIQEKLRRWGYYSGNIDGVYGYQTYEAVKSYQVKNGISNDGIASGETLEALGIMDTGEGAKAAGNQDNDIWLLAAFIEEEAGKESYICQVAVGAVVMNRTAHAAFPDTISGVIFQPGAFSAPEDKTLNSNPSQAAVAAALDAVNGWDPSNGATYYWNPGKSNPGMPVTKTIDNLYFGYR